MMRRPPRSSLFPSTTLFRSGTSINLGNQAGDAMNFGSLTFNSAGAVAISEDSSTLVVGSNTASTLTLLSPAGIAVNGTISTTGNTCLNAGACAITVTQAINAGTGTIRLVSGDTVSQSGAGTITTTAELGVRATNAISLGLGGNNVGTFAAQVTAAGQAVTFSE